VALEIHRQFLRHKVTMVALVLEILLQQPVVEAAVLMLLAALLLLPLVAMVEMELHLQLAVCP
jgi:hypothetical protein